MPADLALQVFAAGIVFAAALISSVGGFGFSAIAGAPLLRLLGDPVQTVSMLLTCSIAIQAYSVCALRKAIVWRRVSPFVAGGVLTVPMGAWLLLRAPAGLFAAALGLFLIGYAGYMLACPRPPVLRVSALRDGIAGAVGGLTGGLAGLPGAPVTIWCGWRGWTKEQQRAVYQPYILLMQVEALALIWLKAPDTVAIAFSPLAVPVALLAAPAGLAIFRRASTAQFQRIVQLLLLASGAALIAGAL